MKNLLFTLAFMLIGSFAFANTGEVKPNKIPLKIETIKVSKKEVVKKDYWRAVCADGTIGGYFFCDCTQSEANQIATIMCN